MMLFCVSLYAQSDSAVNVTVNRNADDFVIASLLISEPSNLNFYSVFGHASIRLKCPTFGLDYAFTYASEDISEKVLGYLHGNLKMGLLEVPTDSFILHEFRGIREYPLHLPIQVKTELWRTFDTHSLEGFNKQYDCIRGSCAKMMYKYLLEAIEQVDTIILEKANWPDEYCFTIRELVTAYTIDAPWSGFIYNTLGSGSYVEDPAIPKEEKLLYPRQLVYILQNTSINGTPILDKEYEILAVKPPMKRGWFTPVLAAIIILILSFCSFFAPLTKKPFVCNTCKVWDYIMLAVETAFGVLITYLVVFSRLPHTDWNWLIIPYNILPAICWHWRRYWALPYAVIVFLWAMVMMVYPHMLADPAHILFALAFGLILIKNSSIYKKNC